MLNQHFYLLRHYCVFFIHLMFFLKDTKTSTEAKEKKEDIVIESVQEESSTFPEEDVLIVDIENMKHEPYQITEEVRVSCSKI